MPTPPAPAAAEVDVRRTRALTLAALPALIVPALLAYNLPPSATFLNQAAALIGWAGFALVLAQHCGRLNGGAGSKALLAALGLLLLAAVGSSVFNGLPLSLAASSVGMLLATFVVFAVAAAAAQRTGVAEAAFHAFCVGLVAAGVLSSGVAVIQVFLPQWTDGVWLASTGSAIAGRASGNLRQPNHLSSLLLWSVIAALWLGEAGRLKRAAALALAALFVFGLVLSGSRTGTVGVVILALWGVLDRRLSRGTRVALLLAPVLYAACWYGLTAWAHSGHAAVIDDRRFNGENLSASRFGIWKNTLSLIAQHPWLGVGWGEFNFAWSLTPFPDRPVAFFDHTHNLPLQFAVELGLPLALLVLALLGFALWRAFAVGWRSADRGRAELLRAAFMMVLMIALHSQLEYPLWYAYFLLPTAFAFGLCLGADALAGADEAAPAAAETDAVPRRARPMVLASMVMLAGSALSVVDYARVVNIFAPVSDAAPLAERIASGQHSLFFAYHADYAAATTPPGSTHIGSSAHYLLDTRLMIAWANALHTAGDDERARHLAQRLREFRNPDSADYFEPCDEPDPDVPEGTPLPYQCTPPAKALDYSAFK